MGWHVKKSETTDRKSHNGDLKLPPSFRHHAPRCELCLTFGGLDWKKVLWMCNVRHPGNTLFNVAIAVSPRSSRWWALVIW